MHAMRASDPSDGIDRAIAELAGRQYGVVSRAQLTAVSLWRGQIRRRSDAGAPHPPSPRRLRGSLWGVLTTEGARPDVTVRAHRRTPGVRCHTAALTPAETAVHQRIPVTSPAPTLADLVHVLTDDDLTRAVHEAQFRRVFHPHSMLGVLDRRPSRHLRRLLDDLKRDPIALEDRLLHTCRRDGLPSRSPSSGSTAGVSTSSGRPTAWSSRRTAAVAEQIRGALAL